MRFRLVDVPGEGTEDVVVATGGAYEGSIFTGTKDGVVHRVSADGRRVDAVANTGGRPLGIELFPDGRLLICDAVRGLLLVDPGDGAVEILVTAVGGVPMRFCNNAAVAGDGTVYFSDSSTVHPIAEWKAEMVEVTRTGRLLQWRPDGEVVTLLDGLAFANGVALAGDGSFIVVAETATRTLMRRWLTGPRAGAGEVLVSDLPGYPDNLSSGGDGLIWVALASPRDPLVERLQRGPMWLRRGVTRIPERLQPSERRTIRVQAYSTEGTLVHDLSVDDQEHLDRFHMVTGVREHDGRVWLSSLHESAIAVLEPF
ncbi:SMP-30/gluconolactonase/LRE family protein [Actinoplanes sp. NPDC051470]|uniref:SMP-30/gluconolactonase/LRE family protein n=1 Tax=Actinoplanes sp. NPDC051470 TaxID=3157224 RepID=UPI00343798C2